MKFRFENLELRIKKLHQKFFNFGGVQKFIYYLSIACFIISILSFVFSIIKNGSLSFDFSNNGFEYFLNLYSYSIKSFGAFLVLLTIFLTIKRMEQTEKQINISEQQLRLVNSQNLISNYHKTKEEFEKYFTNSKLFEILEEMGQRLNVGKFTKANINDLFHYSFGILEDFSFDVPRKYQPLIEEINKMKFNKRGTAKFDETVSLITLTEEYFDFIDSPLWNYSGFFYKYVNGISSENSDIISNINIHSEIDISQVIEYILSILFISKAIFLIYKYLGITFKEPVRFYVNINNLIARSKVLREIESFVHYFDELRNCY